ncbi:PadR family transcriptional regulator [Agromyces sp. H3Y2-19a]|uniref:PadR family transcriptional regulator n=1 Tax=Agromyces TaxID=33877 RepID=UPI001E603530|nr:MULTISPECIES: PadR family transcriptional regulator [Agromyces]MCD5347296.1 PadR family transcriptional regulator [Agromyces sp. S2-1-8]MDF0513340.1 PadR family transcriptional regulator [Agromyces chromiiresistens]
MNGNRSTGGFGGQGFGGAGNPGAALWEAMEQLRSSFEQRPGMKRMSRGDVRAAVLALLSEQPMHGYQIMQEIEERSGGSWKPSAGSVYPTLQLLADEGLITASELQGRKTYSLTEAGRAEAAAAADRPAPWESPTAHGGAHRALSKAGVELAAAAAQVGRSGSPEQIQQAVTALDETRRRLYAILAEG